MSKQSRRNAEAVQQETTSLLDGPVLTSAQREKIAKAAKAAARAEKQASRREARAVIKDQLGGNSRTMTIILLTLIGLIVVGGIIVLWKQIGNGGWAAKEGMTYYLDNGEMPEIGEPGSGISAAINEAYYTDNGGMYVLLNFGNSELSTQHPVKINLSITNSAGNIITKTVSTDIPSKYFVVSGGYKDFKLYIPKKYVQIADDPLNEINYDVTVESEEYTSNEGD